MEFENFHDIRVPTLDSPLCHLSRRLRATRNQRCAKYIRKVVQILQTHLILNIWICNWCIRNSNGPISIGSYFLGRSMYIRYIRKIDFAFADRRSVTYTGMLNLSNNKKWRFIDETWLQISDGWDWDNSCLTFSGGKTNFLFWNQFDMRNTKWV